MASKNSGIIEINQNQYNAVTGQLISAVQRVAQQVTSPSQGVVDGFIRPPSAITHHPVKKISSAVKTTSPAQFTLVKHRSSHTSQSVHSRGAQRSKTLMRGVVSKPKIPEVKENGAPDPSYKTRSASLDSERSRRVKAINQSSKVKHFGEAKTPQSSSSSTSSNATHDSKNKSPITKAVNVRPREAAHTTVRPLPSMVTSVSHQHLERILDQALAGADAHKQAQKARLIAQNPWQYFKSMPRWLSLSSSLAVALLLVGFFAWQNVPQVAMRVAAARAHISASVPGYTPSGFSFESPINFSKGAVSIKFKAAGDSARNFVLTQQKTNWDSNSLVANTIPHNAQVQTSVVKGTTVYIYGLKNDATWVNHGIRYSLKDQANLNSDQILRIADSL